MSMGTEMFDKMFLTTFVKYTFIISFLYHLHYIYEQFFIQIGNTIPNLYKLKRIFYFQDIIKNSLPCHKFSSFKIFSIPFNTSFLCKFHSGATGKSLGASPTIL